jgi:hypothetical protein
MTTTGPVAEWTREATRLFRRYEREIVEAYGFCPWSTPARRAGKVRERILLQTDADVTPSIEAMAELAKEAVVEVAVLIYPRMTLTPPELDAFVATVRNVDAAIHPLGAIPFAMAAFHPHSPIDRVQPERLIPFLRRTPDPTIQIVRSSALDRVRSGTPQGTSFVNAGTLDLAALVQPPPPLRERIARANLEKVDAVGIDEVARRLDDIRRDRDATYARLSEIG